MSQKKYPHLFCSEEEDQRIFFSFAQKCRDSVHQNLDEDHEDCLIIKERNIAVTGNPGQDNILFAFLLEGKGLAHREAENRALILGKICDDGVINAGVVRNGKYDNTVAGSAYVLKVGHDGGVGNRFGIYADFAKALSHLHGAVKSAVESEKLDPSCAGEFLRDCIQFRAVNHFLDLRNIGSVCIADCIDRI